MCFSDFYLQISVHKVGIKTALDVQNKNNNSFNSFVLRLVFRSRTRPRKHRPRLLVVLAGGSKLTP